MVFTVDLSEDVTTALEKILLLRQRWQHAYLSDEVAQFTQTLASCLTPILFEL